MNRTNQQVTRLVVIVATLAVLWPTTASAQHHWGGHPHGGVVVHAGFGPYYGYPSFYFPGFYYSAWVGPYGWWGYPWGPWPGYAYYDTSSSVRIQGPPREAEVYVDGYYAGTVDDFDGSLQRLRLPPGQHEVVIYLEGYRSARQSMLFRPGTGYKIRATLEKLAPGEANEPRPVPVPATQRPEATAERRPESPRGEPTPAPAPLEAQGFGTLAVRVQPSGASVLVDGERWEGPEDSGERLVVQVAEGRHRVEVRKDGYQTYATDVDVRGGQTATLNVSLPQERR